MIEEYKLSIYDCHENGARKMKTKIENFLEQTRGLKLHVDNILIIHLSNKWFHSSKAKCKISLEIERSFYTSLSCKTKAHNKQTNKSRCAHIYLNEKNAKKEKEKLNIF
jgi:hypothetical protein